MNISFFYNNDGIVNLEGGNLRIKFKQQILVVRSFKHTFESIYLTLKSNIFMQNVSYANVETEENRSRCWGGNFFRVSFFIYNNCKHYSK